MSAPASFRRAVPSDATVSTWRARDGWPLRRFDWPGCGRGAILFQTGRADVFEKYLESFAHWHALGWAVTSLDWRGQGGSGRLSDDARVGHAPDFRPWVEDLAAVWEEWEPGPGPRVVIGHSMGGHLVLQALLEGAIDPDAAVLVAPMLGLRVPFNARLGERISEFMRDRGDPARPAWKAGDKPGNRVKRQKMLTGDASRYEDEQWWYEQVPDIKLGPPSWAWLAQAFAATRELRGDARLEMLDTPIQMLVAERDALVDSRAALAVAERLPDVELIRFGPESGHEILREADPVRDRALAAIDRFLAERAP
jgi:lysophospholipase